MTALLEQSIAARITSPASCPIVGDSAELASIRQIAATIAGRKCTVLVLGETGTGKEMLARHIHDSSDRALRAFIPVDCSSLTESLFESQLFGHARGAFTGAIRESLGFIRAADGGTLFLDEIGELSLASQAKLLRVIQERAVVSVGETKARPVDVRILCATHRDLNKMVADGTFRQDLYFRLNVVTLSLPPLRERADDVIALANHFLALQSEMYNEPVRVLSSAAQAALLSHDWPGNVRELANAIESAYVLSGGTTIEVTDLPDRVRGNASASIQMSRAVSRPAMPAISNVEAFAATGDADLDLDAVERRTIAEALRRSKNNKSAACRLLGINIQRLNRKIEKLGVALA